LEELVNADGAMSNSKIPILDPKLHPKKTMDQTIAAARITNDPISRGYRSYYGESVEEIEEIDMSGAFGYEETEDMDGKDTFEYLVGKMGMEPDDAEDRTKQQGKDPSGKKDKKSKYYKDKNFITRATLSEIQKQKAIKMVEDLLTKKNSDNSEVGKKVNADNIDELPLLLKRNLKSLLKHVEKHGFSKEDIIKLIKKGE
jgi:DNA-binding transcriptional regulator YhcF (GntR family)